MRCDNFDDHWKAVSARRLELGISDADIASARNSGKRRTEEKRAAIAKIQDRASKLGVEPVKANF